MGKDSLLVTRYDVTLFKSVCLSLNHSSTQPFFWWLINSFNYSYKICLSTNVFLYFCYVPFYVSLFVFFAGVNHALRSLIFPFTQPLLKYVVILRVPSEILNP